MSDQTKVPELNLKSRRAASAQSAARAYGVTQGQAAPAARITPPDATVEEPKRGFLAINWPLMTAAAALMAGGIVMGMAVGSSGPRLRPAAAVAAVAPLQKTMTPQASVAGVEESGRLSSPGPHPDINAGWRRLDTTAPLRPALAPPPPPLPTPEPLQTPMAAPAVASLPASLPALAPAPDNSKDAGAGKVTPQAPLQLVALPAAPPALARPQAPQDRGTPQAWRARAVAPPAGARPPFVAILIDDAGLDRKATARAVALPGPVTLSFMTYANDLAEQSRAARAAGHELMLHMPMEPLDMQRNNPGPNALLIRLDSAEVQRRLDWDLDRFDGYVGVNNHMGSRFTRDAARMAEVMAALRKRQVFWLDSLSGPGSVGAEEARRAGLDTVERDLFLDDGRSPGVTYELAAMERIAHARGDVIAIGHPHATTLSALEKWMATAKERGFSLVPVSTVLLRRQQMER